MEYIPIKTNFEEIKTWLKITVLNFNFCSFVLVEETAEKCVFVVDHFDRNPSTCG